METNMFKYDPAGTRPAAPDLFVMDDPQKEQFFHIRPIHENVTGKKVFRGKLVKNGDEAGLMLYALSHFRNEKKSI